MSPPLELDYIGLSPPAPADDLKGTELRLGLPGSQSPDRRAAAATLDLLPTKGAKRGFSDEVPPPPSAAAAAGNNGKKVAEQEEEEDKKVNATPQPAAK